jgi:hypothetical protein
MNPNQIMNNQILGIIKNIDKNAFYEVDLLPYIIFLTGIIIIFVYLVKIEINLNGTNWQTNKCSSKYVFFSGYLNNENINPLKKTMSNFDECVKRFL